MTSFPSLVFAVGAGLLALVLLRDHPKGVAIMWLLTICFIPWWTGYQYHTFFTAATIVSLFALLCLQPVLLARWTLLDWVTTAFFVACLLPTALGTTTSAAAYGVLFVWLPGYLVGRALGARLDERWLYGAVTVLFSVVGALALAEFLFSWNPFIHFTTAAGPTYARWGSLQLRGGRLRAEGSFGDAIALGSSLALAVPMVLASRFRSGVRVLALILIGGAIVVTFSRTSMLSAVFGVTLSVIFLRGGLSGRVRAFVVGALVVGAFAVAPLLTDTFSAAGSEATNSASYRLDLTALIDHINLIGLSDIAQRLSDGTLYFGQFRSIDSQLILLGLTYGLAALAVALLLIVASIGCLLLGRARPATIAVVAQLPSLATVALITQYSVWFFFVAGLAVATQAATRADATFALPSYQQRKDVVRRRAVPAAARPVPAAGVPGRIIEKVR